MIYLSHAYAPELLGDSPETKAEIDVLYQQLKDVKAAITSPCYVGTDREALKKTAKAKITPIVKHIGNREYIAGAQLTYLDFYLLELYEFVDFLTESAFVEENP